MNQGLVIKEVQRTPRNRKIFRDIARDISGESLEPAEDELMFFGYGGGKTTVGDIRAIASIRLAHPTCPESSSEYHHWVTFMFVKKNFQQMGLGTTLLEFLQDFAWNFHARSIRVNAARKAIRFFLKNGFKEIGEVTECICPGGGIFHFLQMMEKAPPANLVEIWE